MKKNIRIVHISTVHHPHDPRIYYKQCKSLAKAGYDTYLLAQKVEGEEYGNKQMEVTHIPLKTYKSRWKRMVFGSREAYKKAKKLRADIYVFHDPELMLIGARLKRKDNIVIYDIHEDYVTSMMQKDYLPKPLRIIFAKLYRFIEKICTRRLALSIAEKYYEQFYPDGKKILNYPIMNEQFLQFNRKKQQRTDCLLYTGNVTEERGAMIHAHLPNIHPDVSVQFVGKCEGDLAKKMYECAADHREQLHIRGIDTFIVKDEIDRYYLQKNWLAGIALFPPTDHYMKKELTKFFEYMNAGIPILCSDFPTWKAFIDRYECGLAVDPYDETAIYEAIEYLRMNPDIARQMGENGKRAIKEELNWQKEEEKLLQWYEQLIQQG